MFMAWTNCLRQTTLILSLTLILAAHAQEGGGRTEPGPADGPRTAADQAPTPPPLEENPFTWKRRGEAALAQRDYGAAVRFFQNYRESAFNQDILVDASVLLVETLVYANRIDEAGGTLEAIPDRLAQLATATADLTQRQLSQANRQKIAYWQGRLAFIQGRIDVALETFMAVVNEPAPTPEQADELAELANLARLGAAECYISKSQWAVAEQLLGQVIAGQLTDGQRQRALIGQMRALVMQQKYEAADALQAAQWEAASGAFRTQLGILHLGSLLARQELDRADAFFTTAFEGQNDFLAETSHYEIVMALGQALAGAGRHDAAIRVFDRMLPLLTEEPRKQEILLNLGEANVGAGRPALAIARFEQFTKLYPLDERNLRLRYRIAQLHELLENGTEAAIANYEQVYRQTQASATMRYQAALRIAWMAREQSQNYTKAISYFDEAAKLEVSPEERAATLFYAADTRAVSGDFNSAAEQFGTVATQYPESSHAPEARYKQGVAYYRSSQFSLAADAFAKYLAAWPSADAEKRRDALLKQGLAERQADLNARARATLDTYATTYPDSDDAAYALLRAAEAAAAIDLPVDAIDLLTRVLDKYPTSQHYPLALYRRAYLYLARGEGDKAVRDSSAFLDRYATIAPELTPDVYLWLGDHFATQGQYEDARRYFLLVVRDYPQSEDAPVALYEAARNAYRQRRVEAALENLTQLEASYPNAPARVLAQAHFLRGDIASIAGEYEAAARRFQQCAALVPRTRLAYAAIGRLGECYYNLGNANNTEDPGAARQHYQNAIDAFAAIVDGLEVDSVEARDSLVEKARYRKARVHEVLEQVPLAIAEYKNIFYAYKDDEIRRRAGYQGASPIFDWYYFARSGFDLARLYLNAREYASAIVIYKRLADSATPVADEARKRAAELERLYASPPQ